MIFLFKLEYSFSSTVVVFVVLKELMTYFWWGLVGFLVIWRGSHVWLTNWRILTFHHTNNS